jgi:CDP-6-deoxy-D-xylo-4-hexulose-3-dehydrase
MSDEREEQARALKRRILALTREYAQLAHGPKPFAPGESRVQYAGRVYDEHELVNLVDASLDFWLTAGPYAERFENAMRARFASSGFFLVNSGSSANLLMVATLCARSLRDYLRPEDPPPLKPGDEVITPAVTFPSTLAPLVQHGLIPVFVDCEIGTYNLDPALIEPAIGPRTRAIFAPHTLGLPCDLEVLGDVAHRYNLWLLEDGCDALDSEFNGRRVGTFGAMSSLSFYPAHHMTLGEGGGVVVNHPRLKKTALSLRDWGRDCWCDPGKSNTCNQRFGQQHGELPFGYDHKYVYSNIGYNLKATDLQAAVGLAQMDKLDAFAARRRHNFRRLHEALRPLQKHLILPIVDIRTNPSPFGFPLAVRETVDRRSLTQYLESRRIETRLIFGGNILRQPGYRDIERRVHGSLERSDRIMNDAFFVGVYPGLDDAMIDYMAESLLAYFGEA